MTTAPKVLIWINCYGGWLPDDRHPIETIGYDHYLDGVAKAIASLGQRVAAIYLSGGMTDAHGQTECATTGPELKRRLTALGAHAPSITYDEASLTSMSIVKTMLTTWHKEHPELLPLLFTDAVRHDVNAHLLNEYAKELGIELPPTREILVPIDRLDVHPNSTPIKQAEKLAAMMAQGVAAVDAAEQAARRLVS